MKTKRKYYSFSYTICIWPFIFFCMLSRFFLYIQAFVCELAFVLEHTKKYSDRTKTMNWNALFLCNNERYADIASRKSKWNYLIFLSGAQVKVACVPSSNCANIYIFINCIINHCPSTFRKQINIVSLYTFGLGNDYIRITKRSSKLFNIYYK